MGWGEVCVSIINVAVTSNGITNSDVKLLKNRLTESSVSVVGVGGSGRVGGSSVFFSILSRGFWYVMLFKKRVGCFGGERGCFGVRVFFLAEVTFVGAVHEWLVPRRVGPLNVFFFRLGPGLSGVPVRVLGGFGLLFGLGGGR